jgi:hypothetical protein
VSAANRPPWLRRAKRNYSNALMLSVGREIRIGSKSFVCRECDWEGRGLDLTGLIKISHSVIYLYAYRCPECGSFDMAAKGKLLAFRSPAASGARESVKHGAAGDAAQQSAAMENTNRSWK